MQKLVVSGVDVDFPHKPYDQQLLYMQDLMNALISKHNIALEASTGFGKTLCMLTVCYSFIQTCKEAKRYLDQLAQQKIVDRNPKLDEFIERCQLLKKYKQDAQPFKMPQVIFCSRTHSQLQQVSIVLKSINISHITLASRQTYCTNNECKQFAQKHSLNLIACCNRFQHNKSCILNNVANIEAGNSKLKIFQQQKAMDFEDFSQFAQDNYLCSYFLSKSAAQNQDVILSPYNYVTRYSGENSVIRSNIVIFDEGHNIPRMCCDEYSCELHINILQNSIVAIQYIIEIINEQKLQSLTKSSKLEEEVCSFEFLNIIYNVVQTIFNNIKIKLITNKKDFIKDKKEECYIYMGFKELFNEILEKDICEDITKAMEQIDFYLSQSNERQSFHILPRLQEIIQLIFIYNTCRLVTAELRQFCVIITKNEEKQQIIVKDHKTTPVLLKKIAKQHQQLYLEVETLSQLNIQIACLVPDVGSYLICCQEPYNIVVTSGTLSPLQDLSSEFGIRFNVLKSYQHVCHKDNVRTFIINQRKSYTILGTFDHRNEIDYKDSIVESILNIQKATTHGGILVFFQSYIVQQQFKNLLKSTQNVFFESQSFNENRDEFENYKKSLQKKAAIMLCVYQGKYSEGVDFTDDMCRSVACVSIPFASMKDPVLIEKMKYLNTTKFSGKRWYEIQAYRAVNQACGRAIRHAKDFGAIYLIDSRFQNKNIQDCMSMWILQNRDTIRTEDIKGISWLRDKINQYDKENGTVLIDTPVSKTNLSQNTVTRLLAAMNRRSEVGLLLSKEQNDIFDKLLDKKGEVYRTRYTNERFEADRKAVTDEYVSYIQKHKLEKFKENLNMLFFVFDVE